MTNHKPIVYIIDDDSAIRDSLALMMEQENIDVQSFESASAFLNAYQSDYSGCIILDVYMPEMDGMQLQKKLSQSNILLPIIFLTGHGDIPMSVKTIKAGAMDFLTKPVTRKKLLDCVRSAFLEDKKRVNEVAHIHNQDMVSRLAKLSDREREVMILVVQGNSNKEIASCLGISHRTVEIHKSRIMHKTGAINLIDLARIAHEGGLLC
ncbi:MAG TPA: DNA-binding response regulator [Nitrosomonas nitrosa]|uniref:Two component transcriptional regulator, LuxR family n=1 Tax=Nitrosomonas aestuarii TaxID=52441 RepID=A0A1I4E1A6_9PROT|nr:response regulator [Nitrosomonas aestuarii]SFK98317.1 two component transcriptional regulator, LuxR family [Nitrosomonas aestuarii]HBZ29280.1 DNA-binding response regulator [Nitrosomonas nitrosa]HNP51770.1 response regulator [Nitrosomonas nitrosa]